MKNFNKKGFTLIEMLIVVVIIGILAAALIPRLTSVKDKANDSSRKASLQQLVTTMGSYALDNGVLSLGTTGNSTTGEFYNKLLSGGMKSIPTDPSNQAKIIFGLNTTGFVYFTAKKNGTSTGGFIVASRAETIGAANYVEGNTTTSLIPGVDMDSITVCDKVTLGAGVAGDSCQGPADKYRIVMKY